MSFLTDQPEICRQPLKPLDSYPDHWPKHFIRVYEFDPKQVYKRAHKHLNAFNRIQTKLAMHYLFPAKNGICACGCRRKLGKGRRKWATDSCSKFAAKVYFIIAYGPKEVSPFIWHKYKKLCGLCGKPLNMPNLTSEELHSGKWNVEIDHIVGVAHGGGGGWLSNYMPVHRCCHREKTNNDFGWNQGPETGQLSLL